MRTNCVHWSLNADHRALPHWPSAQANCHNLVLLSPTQPWPSGASRARPAPSRINMTGASWPWFQKAQPWESGGLEAGWVQWLASCATQANYPAIWSHFLSCRREVKCSGGCLQVPPTQKCCITWHFLKPQHLSWMVSYEPSNCEC